MKQLADLGALAKLTKLAELDVEWCTGLKKVDAIGKLPKLTTVDLWASDMPLPAWRKLEQQLRAKRVKIGNPPECAGDDDDDD